MALAAGGDHGRPRADENANAGAQLALRHSNPERSAIGGAAQPDARPVIPRGGPALYHVKRCQNKKQKEDPPIHQAGPRSRVTRTNRKKGPASPGLQSAPV